MFRLILIALLSLAVCGCSLHSPTMSYVTLSELKQGKRLFEDGFYKKAMHQLLPLACDGVAEAQYAVGYMHYYGLGVTQDTEVGYFWIKRAADKGYRPAERALNTMTDEKQNAIRARERLNEPHERTKVRRW